MRDRIGPLGAAQVPRLDGARDSKDYRAATNMAPEPAATARELAELVPAGSVEGSVAWRAHCCGWLRG
jgi:hypothetical protein